jgi:Cu/Ag efflux protein CusF
LNGKGPVPTAGTGSDYQLSQRRLRQSFGPVALSSQYRVPRIWNQSSDCQVVARHQNLEVIMTLAKISLASAAAITIISWGALAQENQNKGRITQLDHINGRVTLQHAPAGTVGAVGASSLVDEYKIQDGVVASKDLHAGDEVDFTAAQIGGVLTITKIQIQKE